jgi:MFS family permease
MNRAILFIASCIALVTSAFTFIVRGDILQDMGNAFQLTQQQKGDIEGAVFFGMAVSMLIGGFICDALGMKRIMFLAFFCHLIGVVGTILSPHFVGLDDKLLWVKGLGDYRYLWLYAASFLMGCGNGMVETGINPLAATMYPERKTYIMNILHAWWPGGLILGGLSVKFINQGLDLDLIYLPGLNLGAEPWAKELQLASWQISLFLILAPCLVYGLLILPQRFPPTERVAAGVSTGDMLKEAFRPLFILLCLCMLLTASIELGPQKWQESVMTRTAGVSGTLILVYTSGLMFIMRHFAGALGRAISPVGILLVSSILTGIGLYLLSTATTGWTAFGYATIYGVGIAYFWPTMLGVTSERFPKGGALLLCLMGSAGNLAISQILPIMGGIYDQSAVAHLKELPAAPPTAYVVRNNAIDQKMAARISLLAGFSADELKTFEFTTWLTNDQQTKLEAMLKEKNLKAGAVTDWQPYAEPLALSTAQRLVLGTLFDPNLLEGSQTAWGGDAPEWKKEVVKEVGALLNRVGALRFLKGVAAAQLTTEQLAELAKLLEGKGVQNAADKLNGAKPMLSRDQTALKLILQQNRDSLRLSGAQEELFQQHEALEAAEAFGASQAFRRVAYLTVVLVILFGMIYLYDLGRGGYKAEHLGAAPAH